jgi:GNAT superfamily N-acetyltransferase
LRGYGVEAEAIGRAASNMANWHATSVEALGHTSACWPGAWATNGPIPGLYLNAIVFSVGQSAATQVEQLAAFFADSPAMRRLAIADGTNQLDLAPLGLHREQARPCFWRAPGQTGEPLMPGELEIVEVTSAEVLADFEATSVIGFETATVSRFAWHAPGVLADPRFLMWLAKVDGRGVGAAMAYAGDDLIGIYGVTVVPGARRRGYGAALTWHAIRAYPRLPAALQPSDMAVAMYQRLGFAPIGHFSGWHGSSPG